MQTDLRRRVARSHHDDVLVAAECGLARPRPVVNARPEQPIFIPQVQPPVFDAGGADGRACPCLSANCEAFNDTGLRPSDAA
jgi:hypothetical protein